MTLAIVNVLPLPVMPSSVWARSPASDPLDELLDGLGLVALGREVAADPELLGHGF